MNNLWCYAIRAPISLTRSRPIGQSASRPVGQSVGSVGQPVSRSGGQAETVETVNPLSRPDRDLPPFPVVPVCLERNEPSALFQNFGCFERALPVIPEGAGSVAINIARANGRLVPVVLQPVEQS